MNENPLIPEFIFVGNNALIHMDMRDMIVREFERLPLSLDTVAGLCDLLSDIAGPVVVIASCALDEFMAGVQHAVSDVKRFSAVMLIDPPKDTVDMPFGMTYLPSPFSSDMLMKSITTACAHLQSDPS